ncbi:Universal stress protein UspA-like protein [Corynebacterium camporealensis]|nr:universal stress protein [Corynebacterium camporealensis]AVH89133.1 Universal stress protein UspA-like protein [Corynebacterium camporealensis]
MSNGETMLIAYDGTERAARAMECAARLLRPLQVEILTAWEPVARQAARAVSRTGMHQSTISPDRMEDDPAYEEAMEILSAGCGRGGVAGPARACAPGGVLDDDCLAIVDAAQELDVDVIVTGTRALSGFRSWWTNSTADYIVRNAGLPVFIVPPENDEDDDDQDPEYFD